MSATATTSFFYDEKLVNQPYDFSSTICDDFVPSTVLEKRTFDKAFDTNTFDDERYGQHISSNYFDKNIGHLFKVSREIIRVNIKINK